MITVSSIFCLNCGSQLVDVIGWELPRQAIIQCCECDHRAVLTGFTLGRTHIHPKPFRDAALDVAVFRRDPKTINRIRDKAQQEIKYEADRD